MSKEELEEIIEYEDYEEEYTEELSDNDKVEQDSEGQVQSHAPRDSALKPALVDISSSHFLSGISLTSCLTSPLLVTSNKSAIKLTSAFQP